MTAVTTELAARFDAAVAEVAAVVERCSDAEWQAICAAEQWSVGVVVDHIAVYMQIQRDWIGKLANALKEPRASHIIFVVRDDAGKSDVVFQTSDPAWQAYNRYGGQSTYIPLKVNQSGVIPVIFASSILAFPALIASALGSSANGVQEWINDNLVARQSWFYIGFYTLLIIFFSYFYTAIAFNPQQQADIIRKQGGFIPGIRPGPSTEKYLAKVLNRITLPGSLFLAVIAIAPLLVFALWDINQFPFGGTALLITVGVALETMKQIDSQLMMRNYEGFLA